MGMDPATLGLGAAALGGVAGAVQGGKGTPSQTGNTSNTSTTAFGAITPEQQALQDQSAQQYSQAQGIADTQQQNAQNFQPLQQAALGQTQNIINGSAFNLSPEQQQYINNLQQQMVNQGGAQIQQAQTQGLQQALSNAGNQGLRGQALTGLQGQVLQQGQRDYTSLVNQANTTAAQAALTLPQSQVAAQSNALNQGLSGYNNLQQQALQNRTTLQSPYLLNLLNGARGQTTSSQGTNTTPAAGGGFGQGLLGGLTGAAALGGAGLNLAGTYNNLTTPPAANPLNSGQQTQLNTPSGGFTMPVFGSSLRAQTGGQ